MPLTWYRGTWLLLQTINLPNSSIEIIVFDTESGAPSDFRCFSLAPIRKWYDAYVLVSALGHMKDFGMFYPVLPRSIILWLAPMWDVDKKSGSFLLNLTPCPGSISSAYYALPLASSSSPSLSLKKMVLFVIILMITISVLMIIQSPVSIIWLAPGHQYLADGHQY